MMAGRALRIMGLTKTFGQTAVLSDIDLNIEPGEFLTLLGPSGCGKSTLLRLIAGLDRPDRGKILMGDQDLDGVAPRERNIAMVFQSYALYPHMSVRANMSMPLIMGRLSFAQRLPMAGLLSAEIRRRRREIDREIEATASQIGIDHLLQHKPAQLSGGQRQRVAVGRALVRQPSVFLMDEPLSNLDQTLRLQLRDEICDLHRRSGITFVYVTHDQTEALAMSDRIAVMDRGRIAQIGTPEDIYHHPQDIYVARFIGGDEINLLPARVDPFGTVTIGSLKTDLVVGVAAGAYQIGLRPEGFEAVGPQSGSGDLELRIGKRIVLGPDMALRLDGERLGLGQIRVQFRKDSYLAMVEKGEVGPSIRLRFIPQALHLFNSAGQRVGACFTRAVPAMEGAHV